MGILPESTDSLKTSYFSWESTFRVASVRFGGGGLRYALIYQLHQAGYFALKVSES